MTSTICQHFVQNTWKKERCSNCFKSREQHTLLKHNISVSPYCQTYISTKSDSIKNYDSSKSKIRHNTVSFKSDLTEIIGYGGDDWSESDEDNDNEDTFSQSSEDDTPNSSDDDKDLEKLTKSNTEYNANIKIQTSDCRRTFTQLMLGQPQIDAEGKKQTLLVSVTPFGQSNQNFSNNINQPKLTTSRCTSKITNHIPLSKNKDVLIEAHPKVILTSYSKNLDSADTNKETFTNGSEITTKSNDNINNENNDVNTELKKSGIVSETEIKNNISIVKEKNIDDKKNLEIFEAINETIEEKKESLTCTVNDENEKLEKETSPKIETLPGLETISKKQVVKSELAVPLSTTQHQVEDSFEDLLDPAESREQAGEPDGRADSDVPYDPPALPKTPPPMVSVPSPRVSFLHGGGSLNGKYLNIDKSKILSKCDKTIEMNEKIAENFSLPSHVDQTYKFSNKRRAPNPPTVFNNISLDTYKTKTIIQDLLDNNSDNKLVIKQIHDNTKCNTSMKKENETNTDSHWYTNSFSTSGTIESQCKFLEPTFRKHVPISNVDITNIEKIEEKKKDKLKKFSLMKFLRMGTGTYNSNSKSNNKQSNSVKEKISLSSKPRLVIIHPLDLNGSIEVVPPTTISTTTIVKNDNISQQSNETFPPIPPPRNISLQQRLDNSNSLINKFHKIQVLKENNNNISNCIPQEVAVYANLGEIRSSLVPSKPQRTASIREGEGMPIEQQNRQKQHIENFQEHVYEKVTSQEKHFIESNNNTSANINVDTIFKNIKENFSSESNMEIYSSSLTSSSSCGIYYSNKDNEISEGDYSRQCRLRFRKGRSVVHKKLEDNYGAVVIANHEALAQVLEHLNPIPIVPLILRDLENISNLHWSDFSLVDSLSKIVIGNYCFFHALWGAHHVTLSVSMDQRLLHKHSVGLGTFNLNPITQFSDLIEKKYLYEDDDDDNNNNNNNAEDDLLVQASISVYPWMQVSTIRNVGAQIKSKNIFNSSPSASSSNLDTNQDACFILLQFINSLKYLQAQGIEEISLSLSNFILCHDMDKNTNYKLYLLQGFNDETTNRGKLGSLCKCGTIAVEELFNNATKLSTLLKNILKKESAMSLSRVKSILEFSLWGPIDVALGIAPMKERELALQRWLDLERATILHGLVGNCVKLSVFEEYHLLFLVRSSAKMMCEASVLLQSNDIPT